MRSEVTKDDEKVIMWLRAKGNSPCLIASKSGFNPEIVLKVIELNKNNKYNFPKKLSYKNKLKYITKLYDRGYQPQFIHLILNIPQPVIYVVLEEAGYSLGGLHIRKTDVDIYKLRAFSHTVFPGDKFRIYTSCDQDFDNVPGQHERDIIVTVIKRYPNFVITDNGDFQYFDLYMGKRLNVMEDDINDR